MDQTAHRRPLVAVTWFDAHAVTDGWTDLDDLDEVGFEVVSVGHRLDGFAGHVVIAQSLSADGQVDHVLAIPEGMVRAVVELGQKVLDSLG